MSSNTSVLAQKGMQIRTVVIDAGHGGKDSGAVGKRSKEKNITLAVALKTGKYIQEKLPDVKVIYTRQTDKFVELNRRAEIANKNNADLFISIHCNAMPKGNTATYGAETFVMGEHKNKSNLEVAMLENAAILYEENSDTVYDGFNPNSTEAYIALSLFQGEYKTQSIRLAQNVQEQFAKRVGRVDRGVQQAGFLVLHRTMMPSVLIELGFLTNASEETFLLSDDGQSFMASAIFRAFRDFKKEFERENAPLLELTDKEKAILVPETYAEEQKKQQQQPSKTEQPKTTPPTTATQSDVVFKVQFETKPQKIALTDTRYKKIPNPDVYYHNGVYKYTSGAFDTMEKATEHRKTIQKMGYSDAFVVIFHKGNRITSDELEQLQKKK
ncbi:MAG: N-acetylmuramoyl-L-alanine amidase [Lentimicrobiaceae bacterium]|nr:N-acetylmuramoyl-L-alanine amidase [Lentimicrobiaceae bacterium]